MSRSSDQRIADILDGIDVATVRDVIDTHLPPLRDALRGHAD